MNRILGKTNRRTKDKRGLINKWSPYVGTHRDLIYEIGTERTNPPNQIWKPRQLIPFWEKVTAFRKVRAAHEIRPWLSLLDYFEKYHNKDRHLHAEYIENACVCLFFDNHINLYFLITPWTGMFISATFRETLLSSSGKWNCMKCWSWHYVVDLLSISRNLWQDKKD